MPNLALVAGRVLPPVTTALDRLLAARLAGEHVIAARGQRDGRALEAAIASAHVAPPIR
jgi:hypothetical protein